MYKWATTSIRTPSDETRDFPIRIGLYQGLSLNSYLFDLILDALTKHIQEEIPKCMLFAYDTVFIADIREDINCNELWRKTLESKDFCLKKSMMEYLQCNFNKKLVSSNLEMK